MTATIDQYPDFESRWQALIARDPKAAKCFLYCVKSTGIFCRPTCAARLARRKNVVFYDTIAEAEEAGFRPCKRCKPMLPLHETHHSVIRETCKLLDNSPKGAPHLKVLAENVGFTQWHFHRIFRRFTGITPRMYWEARHSPNKQIKQKLSNVDLNELISKISKLDENTVIDHDLIKSSYSRSNSAVKPTRPLPKSKLPAAPPAQISLSASDTPNSEPDTDIFPHLSLNTKQDFEELSLTMDLLNNEDFDYQLDQQIPDFFPKDADFQFQHEPYSLSPVLNETFGDLDPVFSDLHAATDGYPSSTSPASSETFSESVRTSCIFEDFDLSQNSTKDAFQQPETFETDRLHLLPEFLQLPTY